MTSTPSPVHPHQHSRPGHGPAPENDADLAELLDLDATLAAPFLRDAIEAAATALGREPQEIVDLGAGTGTGTTALAIRFPGARVHALDASAGMLDRVRASLSSSGVLSRVATHLVDLDDDWPAILPGPVDFVWAALSLHHTSDAARVLQQAFDLLRHGGVAVITEFSGASTYSPADLGTTSAVVGDRLVAALAARGYPVTADWTDALTAAGFGPVERREGAVFVSSATADGSRFLELQLARSRQLLADDLNATELAALDEAIASVAIGGTNRPHLVYSSGRVFWVAVRPDGVAGEPSVDGVDR